MLELDGEVLGLRDRVYDIANGYGTVVEVRDRFFTVQFDNRRRIAFKDEGMLNGMRRIFWHNPLILAPPKSGVKWAALKQIIVGVASLVDGKTPK